MKEHDKVRKILSNYDLDLKKWNVLALRGVSYTDGKIILNDNKPDYYNDLLCICREDQIKFIVGTVDPGAKYTKDPLNPEGAFHLLDGLYWFEPGLHFGKKAFVQLGNVEGWRDTNKNHERDENEKVFKGKFGINFHWGSGGQRIGGWSAGCINTKSDINGDDWIWVYSTLSPQKKFGCVVMDGKGYLAIN